MATTKTVHHTQLPQLSLTSILTLIITMHFMLGQPQVEFVFSSVANIARSSKRPRRITMVASAQRVALGSRLKRVKDRSDRLDFPIFLRAAAATGARGGPEAAQSLRQVASAAAAAAAAAAAQPPEVAPTSGFGYRALPDLGCIFRKAPISGVYPGKRRSRAWGEFRVDLGFIPKNEYR
jgi:hypothetical protein